MIGPVARMVVGGDDVPEVPIGGRHPIALIAGPCVIESEEVASRIHDGLVASKQREALRIYIRQLRDEASAEGAILVNPEILSYDDEGNS